MDDLIRRYRMMGTPAGPDRLESGDPVPTPEPPGAGVTIPVVGVKEPLTFRNVGKCGKPGSWMGCGKMIWWCTTSSGHPMPVDPEPLPDGRYQSHFASCPHAKHFRQR